jgi:hypothetical protein
MALLHATSLWNGDVTNTVSPGTTVYTVPAGMRIIIRSINLHNRDGSSNQTVTVRVAGTVILNRTLSFGTSSAADYEMRPWIVATPGQTIQVKAGLALGVSVVISGSIYTI